MDKEDQILNYISKNQHISQRELASHTGLSLGNINLLIRKLTKKGLLKIEKLSPNTFRYILTPKGFTTLTQKTYRYILDSARYLLNIKAELEYIVECYCEQKNYHVYLLGEQDDVGIMLRQMTAEGKLRQIQWIESLKELSGSNQSILVLVWRTEIEQSVKEYAVECCNILECI
jgi:DNA-binding Lrp family transcriptional regulator